MLAPTRRGPPAKQAKVSCKACGTTRALEFECVECCVRWLSGMDKSTMKANAPTIKAVCGQAHLDKVREALQKHMRGA